MGHDRNELDSMGEFPDRVGDYAEGAIPGESHQRDDSPDDTDDAPADEHGEDERSDP